MDETPSALAVVGWTLEVFVGLSALAFALPLLVVGGGAEHWTLAEAGWTGLAGTLAALPVAPVIALMCRFLPGWARTPLAFLAAEAWFLLYGIVYYSMTYSGFTAAAELVFSGVAGVFLAAIPVALYALIRPRGLIWALFAALLTAGIGLGIVVALAMAGLIWILFNLA